MTERANRDRELSDREHWNQRYTEAPWPDLPSPWLEEQEDLLEEQEELLGDAESHPRVCRALDVAGGTGRNALWLAQRGWEVTIADISDVALAIADDRADVLDVQVSTRLTDLRASPLPEGPWDLILIFHYLDRELLAQIASALRPGGFLVGALATVTTLERNERPPLRHLIENGEMPLLIASSRGTLELLHSEEGWQNDRYDARFVARRTR